MSGLLIVEALFGFVATLGVGFGLGWILRGLLRPCRRCRILLGLPPLR